MQKLLDNHAFLRVNFGGFSSGPPKAVQSKGRKNATAFLHRGDDDACGGTATEGCATADACDREGAVREMKNGPAMRGRQKGSY
ncbi:MAG: hypothetical protein P8X98_04105 [Woeseiaceae bacterium]|jgi:hypothetical protein